MVRVTDVGDVSPRVLEMLVYFLSASTRGEHAVIILESRMKGINIKYRSVENETGSPATANNSNPSKKRMNPARARRSRARLEMFMQKKLKEKEAASNSHLGICGKEGNRGVVAGDTSNNTSQMVLNLKEKNNAEKSSDSPIPQLDGVDKESVDDDEKVIFTFKSDYAEEDIVYTLEEIFKDTSVTIISREQLRQKSAEYKFTVKLKLDPKKRSSFSWPKMCSLQESVILDLNKLL